MHTAVMYGEDDYALGLKVGLPRIHTVAEDGKFLPFVTKWAGKFVKSETIAKEIIADLESRGLLLRAENYEHEYPFCWRCSTPLLYYAKNSWFIKMSSLSGEMQKRNATVKWVPEHIRDGRFGEWIKNAKDWAISRERYWGTPLPIWQCNTCGEFDVLGSTAEISEKGMTAPEDLHRPYVDEISYACSCGGSRTRVKEVADCWFDSGAMFVAQWGYQWGSEGEAKQQFESHYPADYISEAIDQTRGWFYTLLAVATLLDLPAPYKNVVCLGHIMDAKGKKMSKSLGNVISPWEMFTAYGADAVRFHLYSMSQPGDTKLFDQKGVDDVVKKVFLIVWNTLEFFKLYSGPIAAEISTAHPLDAWLVARLQKTINFVTEKLESCEATDASRELAAFVNDLSTWFVRRSRNRFKNGGDDAAAAAAMLRYTLTTLVKLFAPFTPMFADAVYRELNGQEISVHLTDWPATAPVNTEILEQMELLRALVSGALELRAKVGVPIRQALASLTVPKTAATLEPLFEIIKEEINVEAVLIGDELALDTNITPELREKGLVRELVRNINAIRKTRGLKPGEMTKFTMEAPQEIQELITRNAEEFARATVSSFEFGTAGEGAAEFEIDKMVCKIAA
ncbi:MAG: class I tRNA ligase family protein [Candidatus Magasanikbacteria bacterium]|nr:class I tRNA ligase family protein [Candidatus Magasanikbacteria bacterium]